MSKQTCTECRREYAVSDDERRMRGDAVDRLCTQCQIAAAHDSWSEGALQLRTRTAI